jgi:hypothetical protein
MAGVFSTLAISTKDDRISEAGVPGYEAANTHPFSRSPLAIASFPRRIRFTVLSLTIATIQTRCIMLFKNKKAVGAF